MANQSLDPADLNIPAFDVDAKTFTLTLNIHPGQARILDYLASSQSLGFVSVGNATRFCIAWGTHSLLGPFPPSFRLIEAKTNLLQDEHFQRHKSILAESVQKYLARGERELARRMVTLAYEEYRTIEVEYWRELYLTTVQPAIEMLKQNGIRIPPNNPQAISCR